MANNKHLVNAMKNMYNQSRHLVDGTYAALGIAMVELGYEQDEVIAVFNKSQEVWDNHESNVSGMIQKCEDMTGITLVGVKKE